MRASEVQASLHNEAVHDFSSTNGLPSFGFESLKSSGPLEFHCASIFIGLTTLRFRFPKSIPPQRDRSGFLNGHFSSGLFELRPRSSHAKGGRTIPRVSIFTRRPSTWSRFSENNRTASGRKTCSCSRMRAERDSGVSSTRTGTALWRITGPPSTLSSTKWIVQPLTFAPHAMASACAWAPGNAGSREGWTLMIRSGNSFTKYPVMRRMNPANTTRSTRCFRRTFTTSRSKASRSFPNSLWSITTAGIPCPSALAITGAPGTLQISTARFTSRSPRARASTRLWKSVPRPDARTPTFMRAMVPSVLEQSERGEGHRDPVLVRSRDHLGVADRTPGLRDRRDGPLRELLESVPEREVRVAHRDAPFRSRTRLVAREHAGVDAAHLARPDPHGPLVL